jgi:hypothetical protein
LKKVVENKETAGGAKDKKEKRDDKKQQQQQQPKSQSKPTTEKHESAKVAKSESKQPSQVKQPSQPKTTKPPVVSSKTGHKQDETSVKSDTLIKMLMSKLDKSASPNSSTKKSSSHHKNKNGHKNNKEQQKAAVPERLKYGKEFLLRIRTDRAHFIKSIYPDIFKAYSYCMSGNSWDPEKYFDIVHFSGNYDKVPTQKKNYAKPHQPQHHQQQYTQHNNPMKYTNMSNKKFNKTNQSPEMQMMQQQQQPRHVPNKYEHQQQHVNTDETSCKSEILAMMNAGGHRNGSHQYNQYQHQPHQQQHQHIAGKPTTITAVENVDGQALLSLLKKTQGSSSDDYANVIEFLANSKQQDQGNLIENLMSKIIFFVVVVIRT